MKKRLLLHVGVFILAAFTFAACNNDDETPLIPPIDLNTTFGANAESKLMMTYGDTPLAGKQVQFNTTDSKTATLTLKDVIPGEAETVITDIQLVEEEGQYTFNGNSTTTRTAGIAIAYAGTVKKGELTLNLSVTMPDARGWAKKYTLGELSIGELDYGAPKPRPGAILTSSVLVDWNTTPGANGLNQGKMNAVSLRGILGGLLLPQVVKSIALEADGNVRANFSSDAIEFNMAMINKLTPEMIAELVAKKTWAESPKNLAYWFEKEGKLYLKLNIANIISQAMSDSEQEGGGDAIAGIISTVLNGDPALIKGLLKDVLQIDMSGISDKTFSTLLDWVKNGVPLNVKTANGHTYIYLDKAGLDMLFVKGATGPSDFEQILTLATPLIPKEYQMAIGLFNMIPSLWSITEQFDLGLDLIAKP